MDSKPFKAVSGVLKSWLIPLKVAGGDRTMCDRPAGVDWPSKTFRSAGCLACHGAAIDVGYDVVLDTDGTWVGLENLLG